MKQEVKAGQTDYTVVLVIRDTTGAPKTALAYNSAGLDVCYTRVETDNDVVLAAGAPVTQTLTGAHADWGFVEVDATNAPGLYRLDIADEVFATGAWSAVVSVIGTGLTPTHIEFVLVPAAPGDGVKVATITAGAIDATAIATGAIDADALATDAINEIADGYLDRNLGTGTDSGSATVRTSRQALRFLRNKWAIAAGTLTVYKEDDTTASWTAAVTTDAAADPITANDPASS